MPIYEFTCSNCKNNFEELLRISQRDDNVKCPKCGSSKTQKRISSFGTLGGFNSCQRGTSFG